MAQALHNAEAASPNYPKPGVTLAEGDLPTGYHHDHYQVSLGTGRAVYEKAVEGLQAWQAHKMPGISVYPTDATVEEGGTVIVTIGKVVGIAAPCRIVRLLDEPDRWGFAYGTLPGHPEEGEESFVIRLVRDGSVTFDIVAFSRPSDRVVRFLGPVGRAIQKRATEGYLETLRRFVADPGTPAP